MEMKLIQGKYVPEQRLGFARLTGEEELLQRICMKLKARRGSFYPLPEYGSRLHLLTNVKPSARETAARQYILEALADETDLVLENVEISYEGETLLVKGVFTYQQDTVFTVDTRI